MRLVVVVVVVVVTFVTFSGSALYGENNSLNSLLDNELY